MSEALEAVGQRLEWHERLERDTQHAARAMREQLVLRAAFTSRS